MPSSDLKGEAVNGTPGRTLDRVGAAAGIAAVALLVTLIAGLPALPGPDSPIEEIAEAAFADRGSLLLGSYLGALMGGALLVFGAAVAAVIRRADGDEGWWIVALAGTAATAIGIVSNALVVAFVRAVENGAQGDALWVGYSGDHALGTLIAVPLGVFLFGAGMGARASGALPRWLAWVAIVSATALIVGAGSITGGELEGGPLAVPLLLGYLGLLVWIVATSVVLGRGRPSSFRAVEAAAAS